MEKGDALDYPDLQFLISADGKQIFHIDNWMKDIIPYKQWALEEKQDIERNLNGKK